MNTFTQKLVNKTKLMCIKNIQLCHFLDKLVYNSNCIIKPTENVIHFSVLIPKNYYIRNSHSKYLFTTNDSIFIFKDNFVREHGILLSVIKNHNDFVNKDICSNLIIQDEVFNISGDLYNHVIVNEEKILNK